MHNQRSPVNQDIFSFALIPVGLHADQSGRHSIITCEDALPQEISVVYSAPRRHTIIDHYLIPQIIVDLDLQGRIILCVNFLLFLQLCIRRTVHEYKPQFIRGVTHQLFCTQGIVYSDNALCSLFCGNIKDMVLQGAF